VDLEWQLPWLYWYDVIGHSLNLIGFDFDLCISLVKSDHRNIIYIEYSSELVQILAANTVALHLGTKNRCPIGVYLIFPLDSVV